MEYINFFDYDFIVSHSLNWEKSLHVSKQINPPQEKFKVEKGNGWFFRDLCIAYQE